MADPLPISLQTISAAYNYLKERVDQSLLAQKSNLAVMQQQKQKKGCHLLLQQIKAVSLQVNFSLAK
jgi:hypothetical protein